MIAPLILAICSFASPIEKPKQGKYYTQNPTQQSPVQLPPVKVVNNFTLLHTNDIHAHLDEFNKGGTACRQTDIGNNTCYGGTARIKTKVDEFRAKSDNIVLLDAGDQFQGTLFFSLLGGRVLAEAMNDLKYDVMTIGNHEFDSGVEELGRFLKNLTFPSVSSNIDLNSSPILKDAGLKPYIVLPKYKLGIIGFITNTIPDIVSPHALKGTKVTDPTETVQKYIDELHAQGIKRIICLSHNGYEEDQQLAAKTKGITVIIGGHSHTLLANKASLGPAGPYPTKVLDLNQKPTYIVQVHRFGNFLGHLDLAFDDDDNLISLTGDPILLDQSIPQDPTMKAKVAEWAKVFETLNNDVLTTATDAFPNSCRGGPCALGELVTDCLVSEQKRKGLKVDLSMINAGGLRAAIEKGRVTAGDIYTISPFGNMIVSFKWTGAQLMNTLERIATGKSKSGSPLITIPHFSGVNFTFNNGTTKSISDVTVNGKPIEPTATYDVLSIDFITNGGDNIMDTVTGVPGDLVAETIVTCLRRQPSITPKIDNRFKVVS